VNTTEARIVSELFRGLAVLEIGTGLGVSTREIARQAKYVFTVDIDEWVEINVAPDLPENVKFLTDIKEVPGDLDAAFIDGLHTYEQCTKDIEAVRRLVKSGGMIVFHDLNIAGVNQAIEHSKLKFVQILTYAGMALAWNDKGDKQ
jgi:predicted O-methyltransferase YrrM